MKPNLLEKNLRALNKFDLILILCFVLYRWLLHKVARLHPARLIIPITITQVILLIITTLYSTNIIAHFAIGNLIIVVIAFIPTTITHKPKAHWVKYE
jgi:hypothetical protein